MRWCGAKAIAVAAGLRVTLTDALEGRVWAVRTPEKVAIARHVDGAWRIRLLAEAVRAHVAGVHRADLYVQGPDRGGWLRADGPVGLTEPTRRLLGAWCRLAIAGLALAPLVHLDLDGDGAIQIVRAAEQVAWLFS